MALALALVALAVIGALVAGGLFAGRQEHRIAENGRRLRRAFGLAELGIGREVAGWRAARDTVTRVRSVAGPTAADGSYSGQVVALNGTLSFIDIVARDSGDGARQRVGLVVRLVPLTVDAAAALTVVGAASVTGNVHLGGADRAPPGWPDCGLPDTAHAGLRVNAPDSALTHYGNAGYAELAERAGVRLAGGEYRGYPRTGDGAPIVHVAGDARLVGGSGVGILLVDGDLTITGDFTYYGLIIVRGRLVVLGEPRSDVRVWGAVLAGEALLELEGTSGVVTITYSKCLIAQMLRSAAWVEPLVSRGWRALF